MEKSKNKNDLIQPMKFDGLNFKQWKSKIFFYLTLKNVECVMSEGKPDLPVEPMPIDGVDPDYTDFDVALNEIWKWEENDFKYMNFILNGLSDPYYDLYQHIFIALQNKYDTEEANSKNMTLVIT